MKDWGIRARVLFLALAPSVMILLALVGYFTLARIAEADSSLAERGALVARRLVPEAEYALFAGDLAALERLATSAAKEADVDSVSISDAAGRELARSGAGRGAANGDSLRFTEPVIQTRLAASDFPEQANAGPASVQVGSVTVGMSRAATRSQQRRLLLTGLGLGVACLAVAIVLALAIGNSVIRPIRRLAHAMVELGRGERPGEIATEGGGELRTLGEGFNRMAARLQADARELQRRVDAATVALVAQKDTAEQATRAKSRFIAAASHDLRQPLHAIGLFTASLERRVREPELEGVVADLAKAVAIMDRMFHALLDISRLDADALRPEPRAFPLARLFEQLAAECSEAAGQKKLRLRVRRTTAVVVTDEVLLHRILTNLMANAIRYTESGSVMLCARSRGREVRIEVRDSGIGIAPEQHDAIFHEFYQIGDPHRERVMGLGLGLAIVARLAALLGTGVQLRSAPGRGSIFALAVPRAERSAISTAGEQAQAAGSEGTTALPVLVVDDDPLVLAGSRALLEELGCMVTTVPDAAGARAAIAARAGGPVLVLCDMWLPHDQNGIELLRELAALGGAAVSSMLISGDTRPETMDAARAAGYSLLHKPVAPAKLRAAVMHFAWKLQSTRPGGVR